MQVHVIECTREKLEVVISKSALIFRSCRSGSAEQRRRTNTGTSAQSERKPLKEPIDEMNVSNIVEKERNVRLSCDSTMPKLVLILTSR